MAKKQTIIPTKKHKIRTAVLGTAIGIVVALALTGATMVFTSIFPIAIEYAGIVLGVGAALGAGIGVIAGITAIRIMKNIRAANKALNKIREYSKDTSSKISTAKRVKACTKYAKANLKLCKLLGGTIYGSLRSQAGNDKENTIMHQIDQLSILEKTAKRTKTAKKYSKKKENLINMLSGESPYRKTGTRFYENVVDGVTIYDRRTEISCMSLDAKQKFLEEFNEPNGKSSKEGYRVSISFPSYSSASQIYANIEDVNKKVIAEKILLQDVINACYGKSEDDVKTFFPITLERMSLKRDTATASMEKSTSFNSLDEVKQAVEALSGRSSFHSDGKEI